MARIYLDSCIVIYLVEGSIDVRNNIRHRLRQNNGDNRVFYVTDLTRLECRVKPIRNKAHSVLDDYECFFSNEYLVFIPFNTSVFNLATEIRAQYNIKTPDALHLAAAKQGGCETFLTNDIRLQRVDIDLNIDII